MSYYRRLPHFDLFAGFEFCGLDVFISDLLGACLVLEALVVDFMVVFGL